MLDLESHYAIEVKFVEVGVQLHHFLVSVATPFGLDQALVATLMRFLCPLSSDLIECNWNLVGLGGREQIDNLFSDG